MTRTILSIAILFLTSVALADDSYRAGCPQCVHRFAQPSYGAKYSGGIVGGGAPLRGSEPYVEEGTWGVEYQGLIPFRRVWLGWSHHKHQAGGGKYDTERR